MHNYCCYLLHSISTHRTYIGVTNNRIRRLRQHNGELKRGAKATRRGRPWVMVMYVDGFFDYRGALQFEWAWKHLRGRGITNRLNKLQVLMHKERWTRNAPLASTVPLDVHLNSPRHEVVDIDTLLERFSHIWVNDIPVYEEKLPICKPLLVIEQHATVPNMDLLKIDLHVS